MEKATGTDPKRIVALFYIAATFFLGMLLERLIALVLGYARINDPLVWSEWTASTIAGFGIAMVAGLLSWRSPKLHNASMEVAFELKKVTWPTMRETRAATMAVIIATFVAALVLGVFDYVWAKLSDLVY